MLRSRTLIKKKGSSNNIANPFLCVLQILKHVPEKLQVALQVKSSSYSWCFVFVFPLPPTVRDVRIARCSF